MAAPKPKFSFFCPNTKPMCKTGPEQTVLFRRPLKVAAKEFHMQAKRFSVPFTSVTLTTATLQESSEPITG